MSTKVQVGMRLAFACILLLGGQLGWAAVTAAAPMFTPVSPLLGLTAEQMAEHAALVTALKTEIKTEIETQVKAINVDGEKKIEGIVEKRFEAYKDLDVEALKKVTSDLKEMNQAIAELKAKNQGKPTTGRKTNLFKKTLEENWKAINDNFLKGAKNYQFKLEKKVTSASFGDRVIFGFREAGVDFEVLPEAFIMDMISVMSGGAGSNPLSWVERQLVTGNASSPFPAFVGAPTIVAEANVKPSMNFQWVERTMPAVTIAALVPVTKQAVFNYTMLEQEVRFELMRRILLVLQTQILKGTGAGGQLTGLFTIATTLDTTDWNDSIIQANEYDVLVAAATQVLNNNFVPGTALITHTSKAKMSMAKNSNGTYVLPPFSTTNGLQVYGMNVQSTNVLTGDEFLVGDFKRALFNWVENPTIEIGMINDDFERNIWRIRCELQGMLRVREYEKPAFVKGDFSTAIADMTKAEA